MARRLTLLAILATANAHASFDLMMVPGILSSRVHRVDPAAGVGLGSFAAGVARLAVVDTPNHQVFAADGNARVHVINYDTGELARTLVTVGSAETMRYSASNSRLYYSSGSALRSINAVTGAHLTHTTTLNSNWISSFTFGNTLTMVGRTGSNQIQMESFDMTSGTSLAAETMTNFAGSSRIGAGTAYAASNGFRYGLITHLNTSNVLVMSRIVLTAAGAVNKDSLDSQTIAGFSSANVMPSAAAGHSGFFLTGQDGTVATSLRVLQYDSLGPASLLQSYTLSGMTQFNAVTPFQTANIVAPEPASFLVLGLGLAPLLTRRRTRRGCRSSAK